MDNTQNFEKCLEKHGYLKYDMEDNHEEFWEFWKFWRNNGEPAVNIINCREEFSRFVPSDAIVNVISETTADFLNSLAHVVNLSCNLVYDYDISGYTGHAKISIILLVDSISSDNLPDCKEYSITSDLAMNGKFDCKGNRISATWVLGPDQEFFKRVSNYFINFSEIVIFSHDFPVLYDGAPELATTSGIKLCLYSHTTLHTTMFADKYIDTLCLYGSDKTIVEHDPDTILRITNFGYYSKCFAEFVHTVETSKVRFMRTKRCTN